MRELRWITSSQRDLKEFPEEARREALFALNDAVLGEKHPSAKPLKGFGNTRVMEIVCSEDGDTFRTIYTTQFKDSIYVLHSFQKKSTKGKETPKRHIDKIQQRLKLAIEDHDNRTRGIKEKG